MKDHLAKLLDGRNLSREEAEDAMAVIMDGKATPAQIGAFLAALRVKGETVEELTGFAAVMRQKCALIAPRVQGPLIDTCGTGGAPVKTFNVSTLSAFVAAGAGVAVAKHGNRAVTSTCGSADVLEALGANLQVPPHEVNRVIEEVGIGFLFAPNFHPAMKHAAGPRKELGARTAFNVLGPLTNPAGARHQVLGVYHASLVPKMTQVLANLGAERALVVHGEGGFDEISPLGPTRVGQVEDGRARYYTINPEELGFQRIGAAEQVGGLDRDASARVFLEVLADTPGPRRDMVLANAAAAAYVGGKAKDLKEGIEVARKSLESGAARRKLRQYVEATGGKPPEALADA